MGNLVTPQALRALLCKIFTGILPAHGFVPRKNQIALACEVFESFSKIGVFLAESEVGTGKTLAYLIPAILARRARINEGKIPTVLSDNKQAPVIIATSSIALQRAIVTDTIPLLSDILIKHGIIKTPLSAALRKGKGNYLCDLRLAHFYAFADQKTKAIITPLLSGSSVDLGSLKGLTPYMKRSICVNEQCNLGCPVHRTCRYMSHIRDMKQGGWDFQVLNHNLFLADVIRRSTTGQPLIPDYQGVIIDEAHRFVDAAEDMYAAELSLSKIVCACRDVSTFSFAQGVEVTDIWSVADRIVSKSVLLFRYLNKEIAVDEGGGGTERFATKIRERAFRLMVSLRADISELEDMLAHKTVSLKSEQRKQNVLCELNQIASGLAAFLHHEDLVYWLKTTEDEPSNADTRCGVLCGIPKDLGRILYRDLWSTEAPIVLTSGTLSVAGSFDYIKAKSGLDHISTSRLSQTSKPSPFNYQENALIYISEHTPFPDNQNPEYIAAITDEIRRLICASCGHSAVLFTSHDTLGRVFAKLQEQDIGYPLFKMGRGEITPVERFKTSTNGVLFASGALWEGIDIPGDVLSMLIIVRLPFAVPDPISEWERSLYVGLDDYKDAVIVPEMLVKLKQGFGRLIRNESDTGVCAILDSRANKNGRYRKRILLSLPPCPVSADIIDVEAFMKDNKQPAYFIKESI
jgi:ATP-dependent DNA helicase DinG